MTQRMQEILTCPICIEVLKAPVLTLPCQHSLCRCCLLQLNEKEHLKNRCPTCRRTFDGTVDKLQRNHLLEQLVDELQATTVSETPKPAPLPSAAAHAVTATCNPFGVEGLKELAANFMRKKVFDDAKKIFQEIEGQVQGLERIRVNIDLANCCLLMQDYEKATEVTQGMLTLVRTSRLCEDDILSTAPGLRDLAKQMSSRNENLCAISILQCTSGICEAVNEPTRQMEEHMQCLELMQGVTKSMSRMDKKRDFKEVAFPALCDIYKHITRVQLQDEKLRCVKIAWCLKYIGFCCNEIGDFKKSVEYNGRAINHLEEHLKVEAIRYRVLGVSYHNLAAAYKNLCKYTDAENSYLKAIEAYHQAEDWPNPERRNNSVILSAIGLSEAHKGKKKA